jgi:hypothetical protein
MNHIRDTLREQWRRYAVTFLAAVSAVIALPHMWQVEPEALPTAVAEATSRAAEVPVEVATAVARTSATGKHMGFDTNVYPGDRAMRTWKEAGKYEWVGYYLPAPCHKDPSWSGKRARLAEMGWGMAVIYVGQQTWGRMPGEETARKSRKGGRIAPKKKATGTGTCSADFVRGDRGRVEGDDAVAKAAADGFPAGTVIFLDIERMEKVPRAMRDYYKSWAARVLADGRYRVGVYVHAHNAKLVHEDLTAVFAAAGNGEVPTVWVASGHNFSRDKAPHEVGHAFANVWQGMLDIVESHGGVRLPIDVNVAAVPSPSDQFNVAAD